jgi:transposase
MAKRKHTPEFKREAVRLAREPGMSLPRAATDLGIHVNTLRGWVKKFESGKWVKEPGAEMKSAEAKEIERLRRELDRVTMERDILKKATAFFAKESK